MDSNQELRDKIASEIFVAEITKNRGVYETAFSTGEEIAKELSEKAFMAADIFMEAKRKRPRIMNTGQDRLTDNP